MVFAQLLKSSYLIDMTQKAISEPSRGSALAYSAGRWNIARQPTGGQRGAFGHE